jgi:hypothetical protein
VFKEGAALSENRNAAPESDEGASVAGPAQRREPSGRGSRHVARRKKGLLRRFGITVPAIGVAAVLVAVVAVVANAMSPNGSGATGMATALNGLTHSQQLTVLEQERQQMLVMDAAAKTLSSAASPAMASPDTVIAAEQQARSSSSSSSSSGGTSSGGSSSGGTSSGSSSSGTSVVQVPAPDPGSAEHIGYEMLLSFGFNQTTQWSCLEPLWMRESGWRWDAENPNGAYGIPQAFPGSKMASAGADWQTNPATQIKWGLEYISATYGTPCGAWAQEQSAGGY